MKRYFSLFFLLCFILSGCAAPQPAAQIAATTLPVYEFTTRLCENTGLSVIRLVTESVSCLHDYTLQVGQMRSIEAADLVILSGAGLEEFLEDALDRSGATIDASTGLELLCPDSDHHDHDDHGHHHESDPHIWLSPVNAAVMVQNISAGLIRQYPQFENVILDNQINLLNDLSALDAYGKEQLKDLRCREIITFHDGFDYLAEHYDLHILRAVEEESGSEASAAELIELIELVRDRNLPAVFTETNGTDAAARIIRAETGAEIFELDMAMSGTGYFDAMYRNIDTLKEALG